MYEENRNNRNKKWPQQKTHSCKCKRCNNFEVSNLTFHAFQSREITPLKPVHHDLNDQKREYQKRFDEEL